MEQTPTIEIKPTREELTKEIENHFELIRSWQEQERMADDVSKAESKRYKDKIEAEYAIVKEKQELLGTLK